MEAGDHDPGAGDPAASPARWTQRLAGRLFPPACVLCGACQEPERPPVCRGCWSRLPRAVPPRCDRCGAPSPRFVDDVRACGECLRWPARLDRGRAPFLMEGGAARLVHALKYGGWTALSDPMGRAMAPAARAIGDERALGRDGPPTLVPVPLPRARRRRRGYNQADLLAEALAAELSWPRSSVLEATSGGPRQARLGARSRRDNTRGRFRTRPPREARSREANSPVAVVVDDVLTTGSTAGACAEALERGGWRPVGAVTFARAISPPAGPDGHPSASGSRGRGRRPRWHGSRDE